MKDNMAWVGLVDSDQRERVAVTGLDDTIFVEAGAGSGKTSLLVKRIANLVLEAGVRLSSIAAITFTEAAASELASRIRAEFEQVEADALVAGDIERADRCRQAIADTDLAAITTLHGFANRILGEFAVSADLPPRVRVLDEVSSQLAHEDRWQRFVDALYEDPEHEALLTRASALQIPLEAGYTGQATLRDVAVEFNQNWDRLGSLIDDDRGPLDEPSFAEFGQAVDELVAWVDECDDPGDKLLVHLHTILPEMQAVGAIVDPLRKMRQLENIRRKPTKGWGRGSGGRGLAWGSKETVTAVKDTISAVNAAIRETLDPIVHDVLVRLGDLIARETLQAAHARRSDGGLEFHDLLVLARNMLRHNGAARRVLHDRYTHVLLDEFQDTDPIQIELAVLIATDATDVLAIAWHDLPIEPGRLFFVGDPKQSIYRFRRADIALFLEARDRFAGPQGIAQLTTNFRTVEPVVQWVNALFEQVMADEVAERQPRYEPLRAHRRDGFEPSMHAPIMLGGPHPDPKVLAPELRQAEASDVVLAVRAIIESPDQFRVQDRLTSRWRDARLDDITILLPTRTSLPFLRSQLEDFGIRYRIATGTLVYDTQEVRDALAALRAIDDPTDELSVVAALRSPLYACSDIDLFTWHRGGGQWNITSRPDSLDSSHPVWRALEHLKSLWDHRWFMTPSGLLDRLLRERQAMMLAFGDARPTDVWRRLRFLVEQARAFEEAGSGDLRTFTEWAELQSGSMARVHEPLLPETDEESLSIQTIHGSKGLEFSITILSGMTTLMKSGPRGVSVLWPAVGEPEIKLRGGIETRLHEPMADVEEEMDRFERMRLAYVAATRARDHLFVSCHHKVGKPGVEAKTYAELFWRAFAEEPQRDLVRDIELAELVDDGQPEPARPAQLGLALDSRELWIERRQRLIEPFKTPTVWSATRVATEAKRLAGDPQDHGSTALVEQDDDRADQPEDGAIPVRKRGRVGSAIGSAVHAVLQMVDFASPDNVDEQVALQCQIESIPDRTIVVSRLVKSALASPAVRLAATSVHFKELFVAAPVGDQVIEGYVDLLIDTPEGLVVVDYKTDSVRTDADVDAKLAGYELQAAAYAVALERATGQRVVECRFVFCTSGDPIERSVQDLDRAKARVPQVMATAASPGSH